MGKNIELTKFLDAQNQLYLKALSEVRNGKKESHWMWYIFPQLAGFGHSEMSKRYAINNLEEALAYLEHPVLGKHLVEISSELLQLENTSALDIFGSPDDLKLRSCMTLFSRLDNPHPVFQQVLDKFYAGQPDSATIQALTAGDQKETMERQV